MLRLSSPGLGSRLWVIGPNFSRLRVISPGLVFLNGFVLGRVADELWLLVGCENWGLEPDMSGSPETRVGVHCPVALKPVVQGI